MEKALWFILAARSKEKKMTSLLQARILYEYLIMSVTAVVLDHNYYSCVHLRGLGSDEKLLSGN